MTLSRRALLALAALSPLAARSARAVVAVPGLPAEIVSIDLVRHVIELRVEQPPRVRRATFDDLTLVVNARNGPGAVSDLRPGMSVVVTFARTEGGRESDRLVRIRWIR